MDIETIRELISCRYEDCSEDEQPLFFEDPSFDTAIIGLSSDDRLIYSFDKMIEYLMIKDNMTMEDAQEFIEYNTLRSLPYYHNAPIVCFDFE